jgi:phospholipase A1
MKYKLSFHFLLLFLFYVNAQVQALFNKTQLRNMTERWELDTTSVRGTLITPKLCLFCPCAGRITNERPESGNTDPNYVVPDSQYLRLNSN